MYLQTLWPLDGSEEPMNWSPQYTFALWKEQHFIFARVVIQMEILQIQKVGTQSTFFMILVFFFILYYWWFWNISSEYFRPRRALVKGIRSRAKIIILLSWNFGSNRWQGLRQHWWWFCCWPKFCDFGGSVDTILPSQSVWHLQWTDIGVLGGIGGKYFGTIFLEFCDFWFLYSRQIRMTNTAEMLARYIYVKFTYFIYAIFTCFIHMLGLCYSCENLLRRCIGNAY